MGGSPGPQADRRRLAGPMRYPLGPGAAEAAARRAECTGLWLR